MTILKTRRAAVLLSLTSLFMQASLIAPDTASAAPAAKKGAAKRGAKAKSKTPIDTVGNTNRNVFDPSGLLEHMQAKLTIVFSKMITGPTKYCELHYDLFNDGSISNVRLSHSSGDKYYDQGCQTALNQASPFAPNEEIKRIECVAYFRTEPNGGSVQVGMPEFMASSSQVDKQIATKRTYDNNVVKIMQERINSAQKVLGPDSPKLSESINFLANTQRDMNDFGPAEKSYKRAIAIRSKANGPASPELADSMANLGENYRLKGDMASAEDCFKQVINNPDLKRCAGLYLALKGYGRLCVATNRKADANFLNNRIMQLQQNQTLDPLPDNMRLGAAAAPDASPAQPDAQSEVKPEVKPEVNPNTKPDNKSDAKKDAVKN
jgi:hypothetical protein